MRRVIRAAWLGLDPGDLSALDDPASVEAIRAVSLAAMTSIVAPERDIVSWDDLDRLVGELADRLVGQPFDVMLAITRGGMVPAGMLAYRLRLRDILVAAVEYYDDTGQPGPTPTFLQFPADPLLRGQRVLIVDEVWDSGTTIHAVTERVRQAGGIPMTAVLHYKPDATRSSQAARRPRRRDRPLGRLPVQGRSVADRPADLAEVSAMTEVLLLVGTPKGAFILDSDADRARLVVARPAVRGLADPRPDRRTGDRRDPRRRRQPVVRPGGLAERRPRRDLDPLVRGPDLRRRDGATPIADDLEPGDRPRRHDLRRRRAGRPVPERRRRRDLVPRRGPARTTRPARPGSRAPAA